MNAVREHPTEPTIYSFESFELDTLRLELRHRGECVELEPKVLELLVELLRRRDRVASRRELFEAVWPGTKVSPSSLTRCVSSARRALADDPHRQRLIKTIWGRGYRFVAAVSERAVTDPSPDRAKPSEAPAADPSPFVGRRREMERLRACAQRARAGRGGLLLLSGEAGIGKTRMAEEFGDWARDAGMRVLVGRCREEEGAPAFWPWIQVLRGQLECETSESLQLPLSEGDARTLAPLVPELFEGAELGASSQMARERFRLFDTVSSFLRRVAQSQPLVIVLDDLHRADLPSLHLLRFLAPELRQARVLALACCRRSALPHGSDRAQAVAQAVRLADASWIELQGLALAEVAELLRRSGAASAVDARRLRERTGGNPFYLHQLLPLASGARPGGAADRLLDGTALPGGIRDAVALQWNDLPAESRQLLETAAMIGRDFSFGALRVAAGWPKSELLEALEPALRAGLVRESGPVTGRYRFAHSLVRDALYRGLSRRRRATTHARVGRALERWYGENVDSHLSELAHHFVEGAAAGTEQKALEYCERAARAASEQHAHEEAALLLRKALAVLETSAAGDASRRLGLLVALCEAEAAAENADRATQACRSALELARKLADSGQLTRLALGYAPGLQYLALRPIDEGILTEVVGAALESSDHIDERQRVRLQCRLAMALKEAEDHDRIGALVRDACARAQRTADPEILALAEGARVLADWGPDNLAQRVRELPDLVERARLAGDPWMPLVYLDSWIGTLLEAGEVEAADREIARFAAWAEEPRSPRAIGFGWSQRSTRLLMQGRFDEADRLMQQGAELAERMGDGMARLAFELKLGALALERGDLEELARIVERGLALVDRRLVSAEFRSLACIGYAAAGRRELAASELEVSAGRVLGARHRGRLWMTEAAIAADVSVALGMERLFPALYERLLPYATRLAVPGFTAVVYYGSVALRLGRLATRMQRWDQASRHFEAAIELEARVGAWPWRAHAQHEYAAMLGQRGRPGDLSRVASLTREALDTARKLGMGTLELELAELEGSLAHD